MPATKKPLFRKRNKKILFFAGIPSFLLLPVKKAKRKDGLLSKKAVAIFKILDNLAKKNHGELRVLRFKATKLKKFIDQVVRTRSKKL